MTFLQGMLEGIAGIEAMGYRLLSELGGTEPCGASSRSAAAPRMPPGRRSGHERLGVEVTTAATDEAAYGTARLAGSACSENGGKP